VVGSRLTDATTNNWTMPAPVNIVRIDVDPAVATNRYRVAVEVTGDAAPALAALCALVQARHASRSRRATLPRPAKCRSLMPGPGWAAGSTS
jgi:thiamine pyrophosphate-dependent acetolactate synthase large subunit-like protein